MEVTVLKGRGDAVKELANHVIAGRGVHHGQVVLLLAGRIKDGEKVKITAGRDGLVFNGTALAAAAE